MRSRVGRDGLRRRVARAGDGRLRQAGLAPPALERRLRLAQVRQRALVLGDPAAVESLEAGHEPVRAAHLAKVVDAQSRRR